MGTQHWEGEEENNGRNGSMSSPSYGIEGEEEFRNVWGR
jgi:hypothetical protein